MAEVQLEEAYRKLKVYNDYFSNFHRDQNLSDSDYFEIAIKGEITSHALSGVVNILRKNFISQGPAHNARVLIEDLSLWEMYRKGEIPERNLKAFRKVYFLVENNNSERYRNSEPLTEEKKKKYVEIKESIFNELSGLFECEVEALEKLDTPLLFLYDGKKREHPRWKEIIVKNMGEKIDKEHDQLGIMVHPYFLSGESNISTHQLIMEIFLQHLDKAMKIISPSTPISDEDGTALADQLFREDKYYKPYARVTRLLNQTMIRIFNEIKFSGAAIGDYGNFMFCQLGSLYYDTRLCCLLGYKEQSIAKFKTFVEMAASYEKIRSYDATEQKYLEMGFMSSTLMQYERLMYGKIEDDEDLPWLYEKYYQEKTGLEFEDFRKKMQLNNLYPITFEEKKNYSRLVRKFLNKNGWKKDFFLYKQSTDFDHGGGYLFDSTKKLADSLVESCISFMNNYFIVFLKKMLGPLNSAAIMDDIDLLQRLYALDYRITFQKKTKS